MPNPAPSAQIDSYLRNPDGTITFMANGQAVATVPPGPAALAKIDQLATTRTGSTTVEQAHSRVVVDPTRGGRTFVATPSGYVSTGGRGLPMAGNVAPMTPLPESQPQPSAPTVEEMATAGGRWTAADALAKAGRLGELVAAREPGTMIASAPIGAGPAAAPQPQPAGPPLPPGWTLDANGKPMPPAPVQQ